MDNSESKIYSYRQRLLADFPSLQISSIKIIGSGWDHDALEVNGDIIFRIPKDDFDFNQTSPVVVYETEALRLLHAKLPVAVPFPKYIAPHKSYFGYKKLPGVILEDVLNSLSKQDIMKLQEEWVSVAAAVHAKINIDEARRVGLPRFEGWETSTAERIFELSNVDEQALEWANKVINKVHSSLNAESQYTVVAHNDLRFQNILVDPNSKSISGIIDWSDICIAPIARELAASDWENEALSQVIKLYETKTGVAVDRMQVEMWRHLEDISDFVEYTEDGKTYEASETLAKVRRGYSSGF